MAFHLQLRQFIWSFPKDEFVFATEWPSCA